VAIDHEWHSKWFGGGVKLTEFERDLLDYLREDYESYYEECPYCQRTVPLAGFSDHVEGCLEERSEDRAERMEQCQ